MAPHMILEGVTHFFNPKSVQFLDGHFHRLDSLFEPGGPGTDRDGTWSIRYDREPRGLGDGKGSSRGKCHPKGGPSLTGTWTCPVLVSLVSLEPFFVPDVERLGTV